MITGTPLLGPRPASPCFLSFFYRAVAAAVTSMDRTMHIKGILGTVLLVLCTSVGAEPATESAELSPEEQYAAWASTFEASLQPQRGRIELPRAGAVLDVPDTFYYLNPADTRRVLVDAWENPPGGEYLGMLLPSGYSPLEAESWAVLIDYEEDGYISDEDAAEIDYDALLRSMQKDTQAGNEARIEAGYGAIELLGWAEPPYYDATAKKLYWAKELQFAGMQSHTLNYNIRVLGRKGVLVLNFIAGMEQKPVIDAHLDQVLAIAEFQPGHLYSDFNPEVDQVAAYGIGALVAGKVAAKTGALAALLMLLKKFGVLILVGAGAVLKGLFRRKSE